MNVRSNLHLCFWNARKPFPLAISCAVILLAASGCGPYRAADRVRNALKSQPPVIDLPAGEVHLDRPLVIPKGTVSLQLRGDSSGSTLVLDPGFKGTAAIEAEGVSNVTLSGFTVRGNRDKLQSQWYLPLKEAAFADYYTDNGIVIRKSNGITIRDVAFSKIRAFPIIVNATAKATIDAVTIEDCGTLNPGGHNNTTGGILIEEGSSGFEVRKANINRVAGNAIWTHSYARSPRQANGLITENIIAGVGRDAIQVGHATNVRVEKNHGSLIGFPPEYIDFAGLGTPVAIDTAGNVDHTLYVNNNFEDVNGQCIDLDGFHDGEVSGNRCINNSASAATLAGLHFGIMFGNHDPGMTSSNVTVSGNVLQGFAYGAIFLIGDHHLIEDNRFVNMNLARCGSEPTPAKCLAMADQPDALRSGIYLSDDGGRPAKTRGNVIRGNSIEGFGIEQHCITAKRGVDLKANMIAGNTCENPEVSQ